MNESKPDLRRYQFMEGAGYGVLKVSPDGVAVDLYSGSSTAPEKEWRLR